MTKILIAGVSGLVGHRLYQLGKDRYKVFGTYNTHPLEGDGFFKLDVTKRDDVFELTKKIAPAVVIDTHSITNVDYCETNRDEVWKVNVEGVRNLAEASAAVGAKFIFVSTDYVFDGKKQEYTEDDGTGPINFYGVTKAAAEKLLGESSLIVRPAVIYGLALNKKPFVTWVIENLSAGKEVKVAVDQANNPTFADDLAMLIYELYERDASGIFHASGSECVDRYEFAKKIAEVFCLDASLIKPMKSQEMRQKAPRPARVNLSVSKIERLLGRRPAGVEEGLRAFKAQW